ncbi:TspO/MBR family protein [Methanospirillum lacunae]|uniref:Tryptophan-rich sensory protein n=1 Tax=Methanospirillum lacunae TaxID=668570 RepID=A0A2V2MNK7_9EURY|nr:TspO/MBR family protein [Methanospirillum lacunae]PWR69824.1 tryptophan-rich sensory protein [Methanospirillum lacunae]
MKIPSLHSLLLLIGCIVLPLLIGALGSVITTSSIPIWYNTLTKPWFTPPNWVFAPIWTILYCMMGVSLWLIIKDGFKNNEVKRGVICFGAQLLLNFLWTIAFFGMRSPAMGLVVIIALLYLIGLTIQIFKNISSPAAYLFIPYFCWTCCATVLNAAVFLLNM